LRRFPEIQDSADELRFAKLLHQIKIRHNDVVPTIAMGIKELKEDLGLKDCMDEVPEIHQFLDRFYMSRIGIRMLIGEDI
jgi:pyruvate dehydrogenase kinase 2/3/4